MKKIFRVAVVLVVTVSVFGVGYVAFAKPITALFAAIWGAGTTGRIPKFSSPTTIVDSVIAEDAAGNVGIGTTSPAVKLEVSGTSVDPGIKVTQSGASGNAGVTITSTGAGGSNITFDSEGTDWSIGQLTHSSKLDISQGGVGTRMFFDTTGNVGIGTTNPAALLHVRKDSDSAVGIRIDNRNAGASSKSTIEFTRADGAMAMEVYRNGNNGNLYLASNSNVGLEIQPNGNGAFYGNVGIGTTNPGNKLDVAGDQGAILSRQTAGGGYTFIGFNDAGQYGRIGAYNGGWKNMVIAEGGGNVGIGTTNPQAKLDIAGNSTGPLLIVGDTGPTVNAQIWLGGIGSGERIQRDDEYGSPDLIFRAGQNAPPRLIIKNAGNVGIGTTAPTEKLQVAGVIHSTTGGIKFPDGSLQTTAAGGYGYEFVTATQNNSSISVATCPSGKNVLGGGCRMSGFGTSLVMSSPGNNNTWLCIYANAVDTVIASVICANMR